MLQPEQHAELVANARKYGRSLVRFCPPLQLLDVFHLLRIGAVHQHVDMLQARGEDQDLSLVDATVDEWWDLLWEAVPGLMAKVVPAELLREVMEAHANGRGGDPNFREHYFEKVDDWFEATKSDFRELIEHGGKRAKTEPERVQAVQEAYQFVLDGVRGYQRLHADGEEDRNLKDALRRVLGKVPKDLEDDKIGLALIYKRLVRAAGIDKKLFLKDRTGQWRTTVERLRDLLRTGVADDLLAGYVDEQWPTRRIQNKGKYTSTVRRPDGTEREILDLREDTGESAPEVGLALQELRDLRDRLEGHSPLLEALDAAATAPVEPDMRLAAAEQLRIVADLLDAYREDRSFQAAIVFAFMRGGRGRPKGKTAEEIAGAYGVSRDVVYRRRQDAERLLKDRGVGR